MKIDDAAKKAPGLGVVANQGRPPKSSETTSASKATNTATDTVSLSPQSQSLAGVASSGAVFDVNKVQEIKNAIASGTFQVDAGKVADGLIDTVKDLIRPPKG